MATGCDKFGQTFVSELHGSALFLASHRGNALLHLPLSLTLGPFLSEVRLPPSLALGLSHLYTR